MSKARRRRVMQLAEFQDGRCFYCDEEMFFLDPGLSYDGRGETEQSPNVASEDHVTPVALGGTRHRSNVVVCHRGCNSIKGGHMPSAAMLERLAILNEKRNFIPPAVPGTMSADAFLPVAETTRALHYMCDLLNAVEGREGIRLRNKFGRRMEKLLAIRRTLRVIEDDAARIRFMELGFADASKYRTFSDDTHQSLMENITVAMIKREKQMVKQRLDDEKEVRRIAKVERRRLRKEAA